MAIGTQTLLNQTPAYAMVPKGSRHSMRPWSVIAVAADLMLSAASGRAADLSPPPGAAEYDWKGAYLGGHLGYAWGNSNWTTSPGIFGSFGLAQPIDTFDDGGSFFEGLQVGYNYLLPNRFLVGVEVDASFPSFQNLAGISIGGISTFASPFGRESFRETVLSSGSVRGRIGYAPGSWLLYATGGFAWTHNQQTLTLTSGTTESPQLSRFGWMVGRRRLGVHLWRSRRMVSGPMDAARRSFRFVGNARRRD